MVVIEQVVVAVLLLGRVEPHHHAGLSPHHDHLNKKILQLIILTIKLESYKGIKSVDGR